jgi:hypothetical protein
MDGVPDFGTPIVLVVDAATEFRGLVARANVLRALNKFGIFLEGVVRRVLPAGTLGRGKVFPLVVTNRLKGLHTVLSYDELSSVYEVPEHGYTVLLFDRPEVEVESEPA